jgi:predicted ribosome quality control (RQC) complex YloA/Tae2 family protein
VETAVQADAYTLVLGLRGLDGKTAVHVSWHPDAARVALGSPPPRVHKTENLSFGEQTNAVLRDLILTEASVPTAWERVAVFSFAERPGADPKYKLRVETQGRNSNAILTQCGAAADRGDRSNNAGDKIVACAYQVGDKQTSVRPLSPGFAYSPPPQAPGAVPTGCDVDEFRLLVTNAAATAGAKKHKKKSNDKEEKEPETENNPNPPVANGIVRAFRGVSPALARSLLDDARIAASVGIDDLDENAWQLIHDEFARWSKQTQAMVDAICKANDSDSMDPSNSSKQELGCILKHARWHTKEGQLMPHQRSGETRCDGNTISLADAAASSAAASQNGLFDEYVFARQMPLPPVGVVFASVYGEASDVDVFRREKDRLAQGTKTALKKTKQKTTAFEAQIADAADFEKTKIKADEIMAYLHAYEAGSASMTIYDFETGEPREIEIDPLIGPNQTAEKLYKKARKRKRTAAAVEPLLESARSELRYLEQVEFTLAELDGTNSDDVLALEEISLELVDAKLMKPAGKGAAAAIREETRVQKGG